MPEVIFLLRFTFFLKITEITEIIFFSDQFTCNPNQCVDNSVLCDGIRDCDDGSDENPELCKSLK